ncbi:hypothetical protein Bbelb_089520 [Branchiostoma belcheri]|nr:hypothetical protein Bbelb_089520 [Branchiostoma belcheri]
MGGSRSENTVSDGRVVSAGRIEEVPGAADRPLHARTTGTGRLRPPPVPPEQHVEGRGHRRGRGASSPLFSTGGGALPSIRQQIQVFNHYVYTVNNCRNSSRLS